MHIFKYPAALCLTLLLSLTAAVPVTAEGDFEIKEDGKLTYYSGSGGDITIPDGVTVIDIFAFARRDDLTSVTIPDSVTEIGESAFIGCSGLTSVTILGDLTHLGIEVFSGCSSLTSITLPDRVEHIDACAFLECTSLTSMTIPYGPASLDAAFVGCTSLTKVTIPSSVTQLYSAPFNGCESLTDAAVPASIESTYLNEDLFKDSPNVTLHVVKGSAAEEFAIQQGLSYETDYEKYAEEAGYPFVESEPVETGPVESEPDETQPDEIGPVESQPEVDRPAEKQSSGIAVPVLIASILGAIAGGGAAVLTRKKS